MFEGQSVIELIAADVRGTYEPRPVEPEKLEQLKTSRTPWRTRLARWTLERRSARRQGRDVGFIRGAKTFFGGCVKKAVWIWMHWLHFEQLLLYAAALGLCTVAGRQFKRRRSERMKPVTINCLLFRLRATRPRKSP